MKSEQFVFLGGHRKSGTTLLLNLFDSHPQCCVYPTDLSILYAYFPYWTENNFSVPERMERLERVIFSTLRKLQRRHDIQDRLPVQDMRDLFFTEIEENRTDDIGYIIQRLVSSFREVTGQSVEDRPFIVLKETSIEIYAAELQRKFPEAKWIQPIRDPRDNLGALRAGVEKHYRYFGESERHVLASLLERLRLGLELIPDNRDLLGSNCFCSVFYEQLAENPMRSMKTIANYLGIDYNDVLIQPTVMGVSTAGNNYDGEKFSGVTSYNVLRWKERITPFEAKVIEFHLGRLMVELGYALEYPRKEQAEAASEFYKWSNYAFHFNDSFTDDVFDKQP